MGRGKDKRRRLELVFDDKKRTEYLTGFRKRKQERRQKAREELDIQVKEEKKRVKQEIKDGFRNQMKKSFQPIPELADELNEEEFETEEVSVKIVELSTSELAKNGKWIGENRPIQPTVEPEQNDDDMSEPEAIPGMGFEVKPIVSQTNDTDYDGENDKELKSGKYNLSSKNIKSKKDLEIIVQKDTLRTLKNSKAFQVKQKLDQLKDRKKARIEREKRIKIQNKEAKKNGGRGINPRKLKKKIKNRRKGKK